MNRLHFRSVTENPQLGSVLAGIVANAEKLPDTYRGVAPQGLTGDRLRDCIRLCYQVEELAGITNPDLLLRMRVARFARLLQVEGELARRSRIPGLVTLDFEVGPFPFPTSLHPHNPGPTYDLMEQWATALEALLTAEGIPFWDIQRRYTTQAFWGGFRIPGIARDQAEAVTTRIQELAELVADEVLSLGILDLSGKGVF